MTTPELYHKRLIPDEGSAILKEFFKDLRIRNKPENI